METLKIALVDLSKHLGGGQIALGNMAYALAKKGHEVHIILGIENLPKRMTKLCSPQCHIHQTLGYHNLINIMNHREKVNRYILNLYKTSKFDVIDANGITAMLIPPSLQDRLVVTLHGNNLQRGLNLFLFSCRSQEMRITIPKASLNFFRNIFGHFLYGKLEKRACKNAKLVVTLTSTEAYYAKQHYSISLQKLRIVPNPIVALKDDNYKAIHIPEQKKMILSVGALEFVKGTPILAKAMRYVLSSTKDVIYVSVGDGPLMSNIRGLKAEFPEKVIILPHISSGLFSLYTRSSVLVQASLYESSSLSMAEAMLAGKPIVAFRLASIPQLVSDNVTGYLARPVCSLDLATKTLSLIRNEKAARNMGLNGRKIVDELYNVEVVGSKIERVLKEV